MRDLPFEMTDQEALVYRGLHALLDLSHETASNAGWYRDPKTGQPVDRNFGEVVALMHSELSEALEADRKGLKSDKLVGRNRLWLGQEEEFADLLIRVADTAKARNYDVPAAVILKNRFNRERADHKLENRVVAGGKKY